jgi:hypothetical protein
MWMWFGSSISILLVLWGSVVGEHVGSLPSLGQGSALTAMITGPPWLCASRSYPPGWKVTIWVAISTSGLTVDPHCRRTGASSRTPPTAPERAGFDIWVQPVGGGEPLRLTSDAADEAEPSLSPDGAQVVFSRRDTGLHVVGALGGEPRLIVRAAWARSPRFSPDGRWIVYWTGFPASVVAGGIPDALGSIQIVPSDGGDPRALPLGVASARYPVWSPMASTSCSWEKKTRMKSASIGTSPEPTVPV